VLTRPVAKTRMSTLVGLDGLLAAFILGILSRKPRPKAMESGRIAHLWLNVSPEPSLTLQVERMIPRMDSVLRGFLFTKLELITYLLIMNNLSSVAELREYSNHYTYLDSIVMMCSYPSPLQWKKTFPGHSDRYFLRMAAGLSISCKR
jgi:hypothetical protein